MQSTAAHQQQPPGRPPPGTINTTDLDSRLQKLTHGWIQGYNAQATVNEQQIILAADVIVASPDRAGLRSHQTQP
jgi:hypothetical protein